MIKPIKEAFLKHDLYVIELSEYIGKAYKFENIPEVKPRKILSKGAKFVYCDTDRKDAQHGWYLDTGDGIYSAGNGGFGKMTNSWAEENLTDPTIIENSKWQNPWG